MIFAGSIYDRGVLGSLRFFARLHLHGHRVGGTNPSLVEALGAGSPVLAQDNRFNRWVAGPGARFFDGAGQCADELDRLLPDDETLQRMKQASLERHAEEFTWGRVLGDYERLLARFAR